METVAQLQEKIISTSYLSEGQVLEYLPERYRLFEEAQSDIFPKNIFITRWDSPQVLLEPSKITLDVEKIDWRQKQLKIIQQAKQWHELHKEEILEQYEGKYIAIILNPQKGLDTPFKEAVVGVARDFHQLATKVYKRRGYRTIYMPFILREPITRKIHVPTPLWIKRK